MDTAHCIESIFLFFLVPRWDPIENLQTIKVKGNTNTFLKYSKEHCKVDTKYKTSNTDHWTQDIIQRLLEIKYKTSVTDHWKLNRRL